MRNQALKNLKRVGTGISIIIFPILLLAGFVTLPNILSFEVITDVEIWSGDFIPIGIHEVTGTLG